MSLTETAGSVNKQRVIILRGTVGNGDTSCVSELVGATNNKVQLRNVNRENEKMSLFSLTSHFG